MGGSKKKKASEKKGNALSSWTVNCSVTARNLVKRDIGGVIFGCKHETINECFSKKLFGLPAPHFSYVRNIDPGLTLFLFNYSDRKLHGIFEAASQGQMNINPYGWTPDGSELTPYPAQVKILIRMQCQPLFEEQFKTIISKNYYEERLFWFELDRGQTSKLISLFSSSPIAGRVSLSQKIVKWNTKFKALSTGTTTSTSHNGEVDCGRLGASNAEWGSCWSEFGLGEENQLPDGTNGEEATEGNLHDITHSKLNCWSSHSSLDLRIGNSLPQKKWSSLFRSSPTLETVKGDEERQAQEMYFTLPEQLDMGLGPPSVAEVEKYDNARKESECFEIGPVPETKLPYLDVNFSEESESFERGIVSVPGSSSVCLDEKADFDDHWEKEIEIPLVEKCIGAAPVSKLKSSSDLELVVAKLMQEMEQMLASQSQLIQKVNSLEQGWAESKKEINKLEAQCKRLESSSCSSTSVFGALECDLVNEPQSSLDNSILIVGGYDGLSWLSNLDSYSPKLDSMISLRPMASVRSYASVAKLDGELYVFGGFSSNSWYNTVESYNLITNQWFSHPSLTQRKGNLAGVSLNGKIFAIGGRNGVECLSEVEVLNPNIGRWILAPSMQQKRFSLAATELNGILYAVGGYDGVNYLKSVERFDPRESSWASLEALSRRRGCHALVVLNEKLYAIGGHDGTNMVPTVEVFDPRIGSWMVGESMKNPRGYSGAAVIGESIYMIGGLNSNDEILDTVECYKEGHGWLTTNLKAVGKRCFFNATVI